MKEAKCLKRLSYNRASPPALTSYHSWEFLILKICSKSTSSWRSGPTCPCTSQYLYREKRKPSPQLSLQKISSKFVTSCLPKFLTLQLPKQARQARTAGWLHSSSRSVKKINQHCDMLSYGMILYKLCTHEVPFSESKSEIEVALFICDKKQTSLHPFQSAKVRQDPHSTMLGA